MKKLLVLTAAATMLALGSCGWEMPQTIEVRANPSLDLPVNPDMANLSKTLFENISKAMGNTDDVTILDYIDGYTNPTTGKAVQTFLVNYSFELQGAANANIDLESQLNLADDLNFEMESLDIDGDDLKEFQDMTFDPIVITFELKSLFEDMEDRINANFKKSTGDSGTNLLSADLLVGEGVSKNNPPLSNSNDGKISLTAIMDEANFYEGELLVEIRIGEPSPSNSPNALSGASVNFNNIAIIGREHPSGNPISIYGIEESIYRNPNVPNSTIVNLTGSSPAKILVFDLKDKIIDGKFQMQLGSYMSGGGSSGYVKLTLHPTEVQDLKFREAKDLVLEPETMDIDQDPIDLFEDIDPNLFVHAQVGEGSLSFDIDEDIFKEIGYTTYGFDLDRFDYDYTIKAAQENFEYKSVTYPGLGGLDTLPLDSYVTFTKTNTNLGIQGGQDGQDLVPGKLVYILPDSKFILTPLAGASFRIADRLQEGHYDPATGKTGTGVIELEITPNLKIQTFSEVHIDISSKLADLDFDAPKISMEDAAEYLKWIHFPKVGPVITFGEVTIPDLTIMIHEPQLGINTSKTPAPIPLSSNPNKEVGFTKTDHFVYFRDDIPPENGRPGNMGGPIVTDLNFEIKVDGGTNGVIRLVNLSTADPKIKFEMTDIKFFSDWDEMEIDPEKFGVFNGSFPDVNEDPIDLSKTLGEYLPGFEFDDIEVHLYINGPDAFFDALQPNVQLDMSYNDGNADQTEPLTISTLKNANFKLEGTNGVELKTGDEIRKAQLTKFDAVKNDLENLTNKLKTLPDGIRFDYDVGLSKTVITKEEIGHFADNTSTSAQLKLDIVMVVPLKLTAGDNAVISLTDLTKDSNAKKTDLLGREPNAKPDDSWFNYIKSLSFRLELSDDVFSGGKIFLDDTNGGTEDGRAINFPLSGKALSLPFAAEDLDYINRTPVWNPDIEIRFTPGGEISIPRNLGATRIKFDAKIVAPIDLNDNKDGGKK